jgi:IMP cyclohydrolase
MLEKLAETNLHERLATNPYPGRGLVIGRNEQGRWLQVYWIMGRSANSRNRLFVYEDGILRTEAADPAKVADPSLIIYHAMRQVAGRFIATNGAQTDGIYEDLRQGKSFPAALSAWQHEPDAPNYTPRISCLFDRPTGEAWLSVVKASPFSPDQSEHHFFRYTHVAPGFGYAVTTYRGDGNPLPSFEGAPYLVPLRGGAAQVATRYWEALDRDNRISLAVRQVDPPTGEIAVEVINRYTAAS